MKCVICDYSIQTNNQLLVKEMVSGTREEFVYYQCLNCEALQIGVRPENIHLYYQNYYTGKKGYTQISTLKKLIWRFRSYLALTEFYPLIASISYNTILHWAHISGISRYSRILDVGCGNGDVLFEFSKHGFKNLIGIDPHLDDIKLKNIELQSKDLLSYTPKSKFDLIMFNHSFEHLYEHHDTLKKALGMLNANGTIMIRTPIINKAFEIYRENWVQIDAPRHFIIHSLKSMNILCKQNNAIVYNYFFDSFALQFLGSEQNKKNISLYAPNSYKNDINKSIFNLEDIKMYEAKARKYNKKKLGDQVAFFIQSTDET